MTAYDTKVSAVNSTAFILISFWLYVLLTKHINISSKYTKWFEDWRVDKHPTSLLHFRFVPLPSLNYAYNCRLTAKHYITENETHSVATVTDPQSFLSRRPTLWHWNELEVDDEQTPFVFGLTHWYFQVIKQKTYLSPKTKYEACHCPGLQFRYCLKYYVHTNLYKKCTISCWPFIGIWSEQAVLSLCVVLHRSPLYMNCSHTILLPLKWLAQYVHPPHNTKLQECVVSGSLKTLFSVLFNQTSLILTE
jgi:hypothetical protein